MKRFLVLSAGASVLTAFLPAVAQDYVQLADASALPVETVHVTAQRREEAAQDVGIALSVLSGPALASRGIGTVSALQYAVPGFEAVPAFGSGQPEFRLRGVGFDDYGSNNSSTVGVYIDDVAIAVPAATQGQMFDVARVEVLRGPQGTLYGRNTTGGAISFITNQPVDIFAAGLTTDYSSHGTFKGEGFVSGPLSDTLGFRLSAITDQGGTWQKNRDTGEDSGNKNTASFRGQLAWHPSAGLSFRLVADWGYDKSQSGGLYLFDAYAPYGLMTDRYSSQTGWGGSAVFAALSGVSRTAKPFHNSVSRGLALHSDADLGFADMTAVTSWRGLVRREYNDWDASSYAYAGTYFDTRSGVLSQEVRLASHSDGPFTWLGGVYLSHETLNEKFYSDFGDLPPRYYAMRTSYKQLVNAAAVFVQAEYAISDTLKITGGLRGETETRAQKDYVSEKQMAADSTPVPLSPAASKSLTSHPLTGKAEITYKPLSGVLLYTSVSRGVKSGGFTAYNAPSASAASAFRPESLWAYETGFKTTLADGTLQLNGAAFYYDYRNQQVQSAIYVSGYGVIGAIVNAQKSHLYGGELETVWQPLTGLSLTQSFGYKTGSFDKFDNFLNTSASISADATVYKNMKGRKVGFPPVSYSGALSYRAPLGGYMLEPQFDYAFHDRREPLLLGPAFNIPAYWLANASLTVSAPGSHWSATLYGRNILGTRYDLERNYFITNIKIAAAGEPATIGLRLGYTY